MGPSMHLTPILQLTDGYGPAMAFAPDGHRWVASTIGVAYLWNGPHLSHTLDVTGYIDGPPAFDSGGGTVRLGLFDIDVDQAVAVPLSDSRLWLLEGLDESGDLVPTQFATPFVAHVPRADRTVVLTQFLPTRLLGDSDDYTGPQSRLLLIDTATDQLISTLVGDAEGLDSAAIAVGEHSVFAIRGGQCSAWDVETGVRSSRSGDPVEDLSPFERSLLESSTARCDAVAADGPNDMAAALDSDGRLTLLGADGVEQRSWLAHDGPGAAVTFHPNGRLICTASRAGLVQIWDLDSDQGWPLTSHSAPSVAGLRFDPTGEVLVVAGALTHQQLTVLALL